MVVALPRHAQSRDGHLAEALGGMGHLLSIYPAALACKLPAGRIEAAGPRGSQLIAAASLDLIVETWP
jgi:hypothetical protein